MIDLNKQKACTSNNDRTVITRQKGADGKYGGHSRISSLGGIVADSSTPESIEDLRTEINKFKGFSFN